MNELMYGASIATARRRFGGARTVNPWLCSPVATAFQLDASAQAPWTRTMVGFGICSPLRLSEFGGADPPYRRGCAGRPSACGAPFGRPTRRQHPPRAACLGAAALRLGQRDRLLDARP